MKQRWSALIAILSVVLVLSSCARAPAPPTLVPTPSAPPTEIQPTTPTPTPPPVPVPTPTPPPTPAPVQPTPAIKTAPAKFEVTSLAVTPIVAEPGRVVTVEVKVTNVGGTQGSYKLALTVNGAEEEVKDIIVAPGTAKFVAFTLTRDASGMYEIKVAGLTDTLRVKQAGAYPRLVNLYVVWSDKTPSANYLWHPQQEPTPQLKSLALYDIIAIPYTVAYYAPESIRQLRKLNPRIKIVALFWVGESDVADVKKEQSLHESWFLHYGNTPGSSIPPEQRRIKLGTGPWALWVMNPASEWSTYVPNYVHDKIMSTGLFDGVFYDMVWEWEKVRVSGAAVDVNNTDINNDGVADSPDICERQFNDGMTQILKSTRELLGPQAIIFCGCGAAWSQKSPSWDYANGHLQENALGKQPWSNHNFSTIWNAYQTNMQKPAPPSRIHWINADTDSVRFDDLKPNLPPTYLQKMRYGLGITLLDDGYFHFDCAAPYHCQLWWFPEYDANLGLAKGNAQKRNDGTWMREFQNGVVAVNPTTSTSTIKFATTYQDASTGDKGTSFVIQPQDGRIFVVSR